MVEGKCDNRNCDDDYDGVVVTGDHIPVHLYTLLSVSPNVVV
jgi:hypothetical protein